VRRLTPYLPTRYRYRGSTGAALALVLALLVLGVLLPAPALARPAGPVRPAEDGSSTPDVRPEVNCVIVGPNSYQAVFSYRNDAGSAVTVPLGPANTVSPSGYGATPPTTFVANTDNGLGFVTGPVPLGTRVTWYLGDRSATADATMHGCGAGTSLPAAGNGTAPLIILLLCGVGVAVVGYRQRRRRVQDGTGQD